MSNALKGLAHTSILTVHSLATVAHSLFARSAPAGERCLEGISAPPAACHQTQIMTVRPQLWMKCPRSSSLWPLLSYDLCYVSANKC